MKYALFASAVTVLAPALSAHALELSPDFSLIGSVGLFSEYSSRGLSQTQRDPALQAFATVSHSSGFYLGAWTSNVDFGGDAKVRQEYDYYGGYIWQITDAISLDLGYLKYTYPRTSSLNVSEKYAVLSGYGFVFGTYYSDDAYGGQTSVYTYGGYKFALPYESSLEVRYGKADFKDPSFFDKNGSARSSYHEWEAKLTKPLFGLDWSLSYIDTDLSRTECGSYMSNDDVCSARVLAGVTKSF